MPFLLNGHWQRDDSQRAARGAGGDNDAALLAQRALPTLLPRALWTKTFGTTPWRAAQR